MQSIRLYGLATAALLLAVPALAVGSESFPYDLEDATQQPVIVPHAPAPPVVAGSVYLDMDTPATGSNLETTPLVTAYGTITFHGELLSSTQDVDAVAVGAAGNGLDVDGPNSIAALSFDFDVDSITFIYGGNGGTGNFFALDINNNLLDSFVQASTGAGQPAGPITLSGTDIRTLFWRDSAGSYLCIDNVTIEVGGAPFELDIHPTSCPNPFQYKAKGVLPVAIVGLGVTDVGDIDPATVQLEGVAPLRWSVSDVTSPAGTGPCACSAEGPDGFDDLLLKFSYPEIAAAIGGATTGDVTTLTLTGQMRNGTPFEISDCVVVVGKPGLTYADVGGTPDENGRSVGGGSVGTADDPGTTGSTWSAIKSRFKK